MDETRQDSGLTVHAFYMRVLLIVGLGIAPIGVALFLPRIPQDTAYHSFADQRSLQRIGSSNAEGPASRPGQPDAAPLAIATPTSPTCL